MDTNNIEWDYDAFYEKLRAFERCGTGWLSDDEGVTELMSAYAAAVGDDVRRLIAHARSNGRQPRVVRVLICTDEAAARVPKAGGGWRSATGVVTRIDLLDAGGVALPAAAFQVVSLQRVGAAWPAAGTPERVEPVREIARKAAAAVSEAPAAAPQEPHPIEQRIYFGCAWELQLRAWGGSPADVIRFDDLARLNHFFAASAPREL